MYVFLYCMYVCMYGMVCMYVCMYVSIYYVCMYACIYAVIVHSKGSLCEPICTFFLLSHGIKLLLWSSDEAF